MSNMAITYTVRLVELTGKLVGYDSGNKKHIKQWVSDTLKDLRYNGYKCVGSFEVGSYTCTTPYNDKPILFIQIHQLFE